MKDPIRATTGSDPSAQNRRRRAPRSRRSWLFLAGADRAALDAAPGLDADVLIQELEDFVPEPDRPRARAMSAGLMQAWRAANVVAAVRINPLESGGLDDLESAMRGCPDVVLMSKVATAAQITALDAEIGRHEKALGLPAGAVEIVPNIESAAGLVRCGAIAAASSRVTAMLLAAEDLAADLGAERSRESTELAYARSRFLVEAIAAGVVPIDCPYTYSDLAGAETDLRRARGLGFKAKSIVNSAQVALVNRLLTPSADEIAAARRVVAEFDAARAAGHDRVEVEGQMVEVPTWLAARRLLERAVELG